MRKIIYMVVLLLFHSCHEKNVAPINIIKIQKQKNIITMDIENNSEHDYYILNPELGVYTLGGASMIKTELVSRHLKSTKMDNLICEIFENDCILYKKNFSQVVRLPKNKVTRLKYNFSYDFEENNVEYVPVFPYNIEQLQKDNIRAKIYQLQKKLDDNKVLKDYNIYIGEIKFKKNKKPDSADL